MLFFLKRSNIFVVFSILCLKNFAFAADLKATLEAGILTASSNLYHQKIEFEHQDQAQNLWYAGMTHLTYQQANKRFFKSGLLVPLHDYDVDIAFSGSLDSFAQQETLTKISWGNYGHHVRGEYYLNDSLSLAGIYDYLYRTHQSEISTLAIRPTYQGRYRQKDYLIYIMPYHLINPQTSYGASIGSLYTFNPQYQLSIEGTIGRGVYLDDDMIYDSTTSHGYYTFKPAINYHIQANSIVSLQTNYLHFVQENHIGGMIRYQQGF